MSDKKILPTPFSRHVCGNSESHICDNTGLYACTTSQTNRRHRQVLRQSSPTDQKIILDYVQEILRPAWYMCRKHSLIKLRFEFFG